MSAAEAERLRGHDFLPDAEALAAVPALSETESVPAADKVIHLHYFVWGCDWWVAEVDEEVQIAFGYACLGRPRKRGVGLRRPVGPARPRGAAAGVPDGG